MTGTGDPGRSIPSLYWGFGIDRPSRMLVGHLKQDSEAAMDRKGNRDRIAGAQTAQPAARQEDLAEKIAELQKRVAAGGTPLSAEELKPFMDEMWGED